MDRLGLGWIGSNRIGLGAAGRPRPRRSRHVCSRRVIILRIYTYSCFLFLLLLFSSLLFTFHDVGVHPSRRASWRRRKRTGSVLPPCLVSLLSLELTFLGAMLDSPGVLLYQPFSFFFLAPINLGGCRFAFLHWVRSDTRQGRGIPARGGAWTCKDWIGLDWIGWVNPLESIGLD